MKAQVGSDCYQLELWEQGVTQAVGIVSAMDLSGQKLYKLKISNPIVQNIKGIMMP